MILTPAFPSELHVYTSIKLLREALRVQVKVKFTVSLAAPVLHLEIRRHKARGGKALGDPLSWLRLRWRKMRIGLRLSLSICDLLGGLAARRASATSFGAQIYGFNLLPARPQKIGGGDF